MGKLSYQQILQLEVPYSRRMVDAFVLAAGGSILASNCALRDGVGFNIGGGFHHAFPGHGEGFCAINDVAVAIRSLQKNTGIQSALVVDCDVPSRQRYSRKSSAGDASVMTISIHQANNYPPEKPPSSIDIHLSDGVGDDEYLYRLTDTCQRAITDFKTGIDDIRGWSGSLHP